MQNPSNLQMLDNPAWHALNGPQLHLANVSGGGARYLPEVVPFAAVARPDESSAKELNGLLVPGDTFFLIGELPPLQSGWQIKHQLPCLQMISERPLEAPDPSIPLLELSPEAAAELYALVQLVQPGYFMPETWRMGRYTGIRENGQLVAVAGERMRLDGLTELSAICTHPGFTGRGYAGQLIAGLVNRQRAEGSTPFLHVASHNERAIRLYEKLGFKTRREITFHLLSC
ncbi:GNAT family N-acetyltransferase [Chitinophaga rhizosphaerae]|uniref:GNAT family N-acetyltransferase n=1 Tax=Chitinophaga rhizosphaerae TaxID=1864947 RepID=UPI000F800C18|nr:GNAT family N-acetyltransferase [Chitinophaga rhizosphaerae]